MHFSNLSLIDPLLRAVADEGYDTPTPVQEQAIPHVLAGRDLLGCAQTGTGKTAAFALPILQRLAAVPRPARGARPIRVLVLTPTRELAAQIGESFATYGRHLPLTHTVIFGGVGQQQQERALKAEPDILVATPGRLLDLASQRKVDFGALGIFVLDEADRMLDMGFIHDVRRVIALLPARRQTLFFSATMPPECLELSARILRDPARVAVTPIATTADKIEQHVFFVDKPDKRALLEHVLGDPSIERALVFTRTKHGADRVARHLARARVSAAAIHGDKAQNARERALADFKRGAVRVLVATDIAARGIDIDAVTHVINFDLPDVPESYVHRIGRTARAGASGIAFAFCDGDERDQLRAIERLIRMPIEVVSEHPYRSSAPASYERADAGRRGAPARDERAPRGRNPGRPQTRGGGAPRPRAPSAYPHGGASAAPRSATTPAAPLLSGSAPGTQPTAEEVARALAAAARGSGRPRRFGNRSSRA